MSVIQYIHITCDCSHSARKYNMWNNYPSLDVALQFKTEHCNWLHVISNHRYIFKYESQSISNGNGRRLYWKVTNQSSMLWFSSYVIVFEFSWKVKENKIGGITYWLTLVSENIVHGWASNILLLKYDQSIRNASYFFSFTFQENSNTTTYLENHNIDD